MLTKGGPTLELLLHCGVYLAYAFPFSSIGMYDTYSLALTRILRRNMGTFLSPVSEN